MGNDPIRANEKQEEFCWGCWEGAAHRGFEDLNWKKRQGRERPQVTPCEGGVVSAEDLGPAEAGVGLCSVLEEPAHPWTPQ